MRALSELKMGEQATIVGYNFTKPAVLQQLLEMGMTKGTVVKVSKLSPLGDPREIDIRGYQLSMRSSEAALIQVQS